MGKLRWDATQIISKWGNLFLKVKASCFLKMKIYLFLWHLIRGCFPFLQLSSHHLLPICTTCTCTKANMPPQPKKTPKPAVFVLLVSLSPSVLLLLLWPSVVLLFSLHGITSQIATSGSVHGATSAVEGWWARRHSDICQLEEENGLAETLLKIKLSSRRNSKTKTP